MHSRGLRRLAIGRFLALHSVVANNYTFLQAQMPKQEDTL